MIYEFDWTRRTIARANPPQEGRPSPEEVRRRLFGARGDEHAGRRPPQYHLVRWLAHVFQGRERAWVSVWGARATTDKLEARGAIRRRPGPPGSGDEQIRLTRYGRELVLGLDRENPSADERRRAAERARDPLEQLRERLRRGEISTERVRLAAALGDERAVALEPVERIQWRLLGGSEILARIGLVTGGGTRFATAFAVECAQHVMTGSHAEMYARNAISAAKRWLNEPERSAVNAVTAAHAARDAFDAAGVHAGTRLSSVEYAAGFAASSVNNGFSHAAAAATYAADAAAHDGLEPVEHEWRAPTREREWQRLRLIAYVLGEA